MVARSLSACSRIQVETIRFNDKTGVNDGNLCVRGRFGYSYVNSEDRLTRPLVRKDGKLVETDWKEALDAVVSGFAKARAEQGVGIIAGARLTNEEFFLLKNLAGAIGTGNLDHSGGECYKGVTEGLAQTLGSPLPPAPFRRLKNAMPFSLSVPISTKLIRFSAWLSIRR